VDAVVLATTTSNFSCPATAPMVAAKLGMAGVLAFDISAACTGFIYGLAVVSSLITAGVVKSALLIGADTFTQTLDPNDRSTRVLFGDGAGAIVLVAGDVNEDGALLAFDLGSDGSQVDLLMTPAISRTERMNGRASNYFRMDGKAVFEQAVTHMTASVQRVLDIVSWNIADLDHLVPHQANTRILAEVADQLSVDCGRRQYRRRIDSTRASPRCAAGASAGRKQYRDYRLRRRTHLGVSCIALAQDHRDILLKERKTMPYDTDIEDRLLALISTASGVPQEEIKLETRFEELNFDSLVLIQLSLKLRKEFGVTEVNDELDLLETVDELLQLVKKRQAA